MEPNKPIGANPQERPIERYDRRNWALLGVGAVLILMGFWVLALADERAANLPGYISPIVILSGYALLFAGLARPPYSNSGQGMRADVK